MTSVLIKVGIWRMTWQQWSYAATSQGTSEKLGETQTFLPWGHQWEHGFVNMPILAFMPPELWDNKFRWLNHSICGSSLGQIQQANPSSKCTMNTRQRRAHLIRDCGPPCLLGKELMASSLISWKVESLLYIYMTESRHPFIELMDSTICGEE